MFWYWLAAAPALLLSFAGLLAQRRRTRYILDRLAAPAGFAPPATLIVPVKGQDEGLRQNLAALANQDYPNYELLIVARTASDIPPGVLPRRSRIVLGGRTENPHAAEKIRNLEAGVRAARHVSAIFAFADSDGRPTRGWLRALVAPLEAEGVGASTGYRWFTPEPATFWSLMASVWNSVAGGLLGAGDNPFAWGRAMAIRKETFFAVRVLGFWKGAVSDDYALSAAVHKAGLTIAYAPGALTPSFDRPRCATFFRWIRRQTIITRVYQPRLWRSGFAAHSLYCAAMAAGIAAWSAGYRPAAAALAVQLACGMALGWRRLRLARRALPESAGWFRHYAWAHVVLGPLATWVWLISFLSSARSNVIEWRGKSYDLKTANR